MNKPFISSMDEASSLAQAEHEAEQKALEEGSSPFFQRLHATMQDPLKVGDRVRYKDVSLMAYKGTLVALGRTKHGGDCLVKWDNDQHLQVEECLSNLTHLK